MEILNCGHVNIRTDQGEVRSYIIREFTQPITDQDDRILIRIKGIISDTGETNLNTIKTLLDTRDF